MQHTAPKFQSTAHQIKLQQLHEKVGTSSQYPHEQEILFAPLTALEVKSIVVKDGAVVVQVRPSLVSR